MAADFQINFKFGNQVGDGDIDALNNDFVSPLINDTAITNNIDTKYINQGNRKNNLFDIAPRLGFSYDLFGDNRTTIRGGLGLFYDRVAYIYPYYQIAIYSGLHIQSTILKLPIRKH